MAKRAGKPIDVPRLQAEVAAVGVELLSAHCATDRIRLQYSPARYCRVRRTALLETRHCLRRSALPVFLGN